MGIRKQLAAGTAFVLLYGVVLPARAEFVAVGRDQNQEFPSLGVERVEVRSSENNPEGDPNALVAPFEGQGPCLVYSRDDELVLDQQVELALFDGNDNLVGQPVVNVTNTYHTGVDSTCGSVEPPPENEQPIAVNDDFGENYEGANVLANDIDPEGDPLTARLVEQAENGTVVLNSDGTFTYTPDPGFTGPDQFLYTANDGFRDATSDGIVTLVVTEPVPPTNTAPVAVDDDFGEGFSGANVLDNDTDAEGDTLTATLESGTTNGSVVLNSDGTFSYTPDVGYSGPESFSYRASDGELTSDVATVSFTVTLPEDNEPPVANPDDVGDDFSGTNLLDNDVDPNQDQLYAVKVSDPEHGELELNDDGTFVYTPYAGYSGPDSFSYKVRDRPQGDPDGLESQPVLVRLQVDGDATAAGGITDKRDADGVSVLADATPNELRTSRTIDRICPRLEPDSADEQDLLELCGNLRKQATSAKQALTALEAITPEELTAIGKAFRVLSFSRFRNIGARIARVREDREGQGRGVSIAGLNINLGDQRVHGRDIENALGETLDAMGMGASADEGGEDLLREYSRLGLFLRGDLNFGDQDKTRNESAFDFDAQTLTAGADYRINDNFFTGVSASLGQTEIEFADQAGDITTDNYALAVYGSLYSGAGYVDGILSYGWTDVETERHIVYSDAGGEVDRTARGETDGSEYYVSVNAGYTFRLGGFNFDPLVRAFYLDGEVDPYREFGAGGWDLDIGEQGFESLSLSAGGQLSYTFLPSWGVIIPYLRAEYTHEFEDSADGIRYRFANANLPDSEMLIEGDTLDSDFLVYSAGLTAQVAHGFSGFVNYQVLGSYENLSGEILSFGLRWEARF